MVLKLAFTSVLFTIAVSLLYSESFTYPNTYLSYANISQIRTKTMSSLLTYYMEKPVYIKVKERIYTYTYEDLGVSLDKHLTEKTIYERNRKIVPLNIIEYIHALTSKTLLFPTLSFLKDYHAFMRNTVFDFTETVDEIVVDEQNKALIYHENAQRYKIDGENLSSLLVYNFGKDGAILEPRLIKIENTAKHQYEEQNKKIETVYAKPVLVVLKGGKDATNIRLSSEQLKSILSFELGAGNTIQFKTNSDALRASLEPYISMYDSEHDKTFSLINLKKELSLLASSRFNGERADVVESRIDYVPNSDGTRAKKYIEIDISQQRMYLFENTEVVSTYRISTGKYYPTPTGEFKILNKAVNAFSDIYHVWMPYWMAFYYHPGLNAYFGIHELPYWISNNGQKVQRPRANIGTPSTGGCIALDIDTAKIVYEFSEVNMPVYVYD